MRMPEYLVAQQVSVENGMRLLMDALAPSNLPLYRMMRYQLGWLESDGSPTSVSPPSRLYGTLCAEIAQTFDANSSSEIVSTAIELFHNSTIVHEDLQFGEPNVSTRPSIWWVWGPAQAINVGDGLHALARLCVLQGHHSPESSSATLRAMQILDSTAMRYYEGQFFELTYQERLDITEKQYLDMARAKSGSLIGGAMALGAQVANCSQATVDAVQQFGELFGMAWQLAEDENQIWPTSPQLTPPARLLNKSKLFPIVHAFETGSLQHKRKLGEIYFKRVIEIEDTKQIEALLSDLDARQYTRNKIQDTVESAVHLLTNLEIPEKTVRKWQDITWELLAYD